MPAIEIALNPEDLETLSKSLLHRSNYCQIQANGAARRARIVKADEWAEEARKNKELRQYIVDEQMKINKS